MKLLPALLLMPCLIISCLSGERDQLAVRLTKNEIEVASGNTRLKAGNDLYFQLSLRNGPDECLISGPNNRSVLFELKDSTGEVISFRRKEAGIRDFHDLTGHGREVFIKAVSADKRLAAVISLKFCDQLPGMIMLKSSVKNLSDSPFYTSGYSLAKLVIGTNADTSWMTFQGAGYKWGQDFVFRLPGTFSRENFMGMNAVKAGGGIPVSDVWNRNFGAAVASISDGPEYVSLPVRALPGKIDMCVSYNAGNKSIQPGESLVTGLAAIIPHQGDFFEPLRKYSLAVKNLLPPFLKPAAACFQPEWCTWGYGRNFTMQDVISKIDTLKSLGIKTVILDDGWSANHGDWVPDRRKFPHGEKDFRFLIDKLHENGFRVWLWWVPGYTDSTATLASEHPDWLIKNPDGRIHPSYGLCPAYAPVMEHYKELVTKFVADYKLDGFKLDFGEINCAPPCYNPLHHHASPSESFRATPALFRLINQTARHYKPDMVLEYCACSIPPHIYHLPYINLAVTSDPSIGQITNRIKMYKALIGNDCPVLEEYDGVLAGPLYQMVIGAGGVPGTFSTYLDGYHGKWLKIYQEKKLGEGTYMNLYDIGFSYPEAHAISKDGKLYYAFFTHPWEKLENTRWYRFGSEFDARTEGGKEFKFPEESWSGKVELRGLQPGKQYRIIDYENERVVGMIEGSNPVLEVAFINYLLLEATPL